VPDRTKIMRIEFREQRIGNSQTGVMDAQMFFQGETATMNGFQAFVRF
jgi:hypothetical protein